MEWMKGKRTYILGAIMVIQSLFSWILGETSVVQFAAEVPELLGGLGLMTLRASIPSSS